MNKVSLQTSLERNSSNFSFSYISFLGVNFGNLTVKTNNLPWICVGDFNEVLSVTKKQGGLDRPFRQIENFQQCINMCGLKDIGYVGSWFTWSMFRTDLGWIRECIDFLFATTEWLNMFPMLSFTT